MSRASCFVSQHDRAIREGELEERQRVALVCTNEDPHELFVYAMVSNTGLDDYRWRIVGLLAGREDPTPTCQEWCVSG